MKMRICEQKCNFQYIFNNIVVGVKIGCFRVFVIFCQFSEQRASKYANTVFPEVKFTKESENPT